MFRSVFLPFYRKPLPVFNAPALNNALQAANSQPLYSITGPGGFHYTRVFQATEAAQVQNQAAVVNGIGGVTTYGSFGSQSLTDPNASSSKSNARSI